MNILENGSPRMASGSDQISCEVTVRFLLRQVCAFPALYDVEAGDPSRRLRGVAPWLQGSCLDPWDHANAGFPSSASHELPLMGGYREGISGLGSLMPMLPVREIECELRKARGEGQRLPIRGRLP